MTREQRLTRVFVELADTLIDEFDTLDFLHTLTDSSVELLGADAAGLILGNQRGQLQVVASTSHQDKVLELFELQSSEGPSLDCFDSGEAVVNVGPDEFEERWPTFHTATMGAGFRSAHALPMRLRDQVIGAMSLFCVDRSTLSDGDVALAQAMADVATIGLLHERAVREQGLLAEQLQTALNSRILIEQAKGALAERAHVDVNDAFRMMRSYSRRTAQPLSGVAASVIDGSIDLKLLLPR